MIGLARALAASAIAAATAAACSPGNSRDVVPDSREVRLVGDGGAPPPEPPSSEGYAYVARRRHASIGLVGSRNAKPEDAARTVDRIADDLDACAARLQTRGDLVSGALQLVVVGSENGRAEITDVRLAPGGPVAANALECVIAPLRATMLTPSFTLAIEATWGPAGAAAPGDR
ncbi:MAG: hypothetical protein JST00_41510 [Deltaproteobacteria bacterium]|nr:hypothetical protein [Deltaproteobacteria bacterium]